MAKQEVDLKKVELKVSVDCCDGCKKKVKKALNSIQGVLKTEIDPLQSKVTIQGNVDPQTLINKLQIKAGKQAQLWTYDNHDNSTTETKEISTTTTVKIEHEISKSKHLEDPQESHAENAANTADGGSSCKRALKNNDHDEDTNKNENPLPHHHLLKNNDHDEDTNKNENPLPHHHLQTNSLRRLSTSKARTRKQYCYAVQPCTITLPHYAVHSYRMPPPLTSEQSYNQEQYYYETPVFQPSIPTPSTRVEDYFSDENTVGCYVM